MSQVISRAINSRVQKYALLCAMFTMPAFAQDDVATLVTTKRCNACHEISDASLGPPWQAIATRHAARKDLMQNVLAVKIVRGGGGNWGNVPMVPNQRVSADEAQRMAAWILDLPAGN
jgi:cytochrome c